MIFPTIQFKATNTVLEGTLQDTIERKLQTLARYMGEATDATCAVEFEKIGAHQHGRIHRVEVNLYSNGKLFRAEATEESFENAIDRVRSQLDTEMKKSTKRHETLVKRGGRMLKDMMRWGSK